MISSVAVLAYEGVSTFGLGVTAEIFGCDRSAEGLPRYDYAVTAAAPGMIRTDVGLPIVVEAGLDRLSAADLGTRTSHSPIHGSAGSESGRSASRRSRLARE